MFKIYGSQMRNTKSSSYSRLSVEHERVSKDRIPCLRGSCLRKSVVTLPLIFIGCVRACVWVSEWNSRCFGIGLACAKWIRRLREPCHPPCWTLIGRVVSARVSQLCVCAWCSVRAKRWRFDLTPCSNPRGTHTHTHTRQLGYRQLRRQSNLAHAIRPVKGFSGAFFKKQASSPQMSVHNVLESPHSQSKCWPHATRNDRVPCQKVFYFDLRLTLFNLVNCFSN